jgi:hypothetical protein
MWLLLPFGFYSIVAKPGDRAAGLLTVRARAAADLDELRARVPALGVTVHGGGTDYPFRAQVPREALGAVLAGLVVLFDYDNFKAEVARHDASRAQLYHRVWAELARIPALARRVMQ